MKIINREELIKALESVKPGLSKQGLIEQSTHFLFDKDTIRSYNDQITITQKFESGVEGSIPSGELYKLLQKLKDKELEIEQNGSELLIKGKRTKACIKTEEVKLEPIKIPDKKYWEELPKDFSESLKFCIFTASKNNIKPSFTCLSAEKDYILSCDNFRATKKIMESIIERPFLIPATVAKYLTNYKPITYAVQKNWLFFCNDNNILFSCRQVDYEYPDINQFFNVKGEKIKFPKSLAGAIDRSQTFVTADFEEDLEVDLTISDKKITCRGEGNIGWVEEDTRINYKGPEIKIKINPSFLSQIVNLRDVIIGKTCLLFEGENFSHVVRLSGE